MRINPKIDLVFKKLFGSEENTDILLSLINAILPENEQITKLKLKNPYNVSDYAEGKLSILDIKAEDEYGNLYDIEMQLKGSSFYGKRTLYYWAKMFGSQLDYVEEDKHTKQKKARKKYAELSKCIVISLMDFSFFKDKRYHRCFMLQDRETHEVHPDLDYLDLYFIELEKFNKDLEFVQTTLERWITFLNTADLYSRDSLPRELAEIETIKKASERLAVMYLTEKERNYYDSQQRRYLDELSRIQEAVDEEVKKVVGEAVRKAVEKTEQETQLKEKINIARAFKKEGIPIEVIAKNTGLSPEQIENL